MTGNELRAAYFYRAAMREAQWAALNLYAAYRAEPSEEALYLLRGTAYFLGRVTQQAKQAHLPLVPILQLDADGTEVRRSFGP